MKPLDVVASLLVLAAVAMEGHSDNVQYAYQTERHRKMGKGEELTQEEDRGFHERGLYAWLRKPNYVAEQMVWSFYYLFSVSATGKLFNWSIVGPILLVSLFQGSGWMTEAISRKKYPLYEDYMTRVGRYTPFKAFYYRIVKGGEKQKGTTL